MNPMDTANPNSEVGRAVGHYGIDDAKKYPTDCGSYQRFCT